MRITLLLTVALAGTGFARDQPAKPSPEIAGAADRLEDILRAWAKASDSVQQSHYTVRMTSFDSVIRSQEVGSEEVWFRNPNLLRIDMKDDKGSRSRVLYCKGKEVHCFGDQRELIFHLSDGFGFPEDPNRYPDTFLASFGGGILEQAWWLRVGLPVKNLRGLFDVRLAKEDQYWIYLELRPQKPRDRANYQFLRVVLGRKDMRVRQIYIRQPNSEVCFDFDKPVTTTPVTPESITKGLPVDCERVEMPDSDTPEKPVGK